MNSTKTILSKIDYSIYSDKQRAEHVRKILSENASTPTQQQLEVLANYILFGKDENKLTNAIQQKHILRPNTKFSTYARKNEESLDELMENPLFDESQAHDYAEKNTYTKPKTTIARAKYAKDGTVIDQGDSNIPGMRVLWESIDRLARKLNVYQGKEKPKNEEEELALHWDSLTAYKMRHWLISLRQEQYALRDVFKPYITPCHTFAQTGAINWFSDSGYWRSTTKKLAVDENCEEDTYYYYKSTKDGRYRISKKDGTAEEWHIVRNHTLDFTNPEHIYQLFEHYDALKKSSWDDLNGQMKHILMTLEDLSDKAELTDIQKHIVDRKVLKYTNERIKQELSNMFNVDYNMNYISTIYKKMICSKIANAAKLQIKEYENKDNPYAWKKCTCCGRLLLIDSQNFVRKDGTVDGFSCRCKKCDKAIREKKVMQNAEI